MMNLLINARQMRKYDQPCPDKMITLEFWLLIDYEPQLLVITRDTS